MPSDEDWTPERVEVSPQVLADTRRLRAEAMASSWVGWGDEYSSESKDALRAGERWDEQNPGLAALLRAVDGG